MRRHSQVLVLASFCSYNNDSCFADVLPVWTLHNMTSCIPGKNTTIRRATVRETGVSRHQGDSIEGPPENHRVSLKYCTDGLKELSVVPTLYRFTSALQQPIRIIHLLRIFSFFRVKRKILNQIMYCFEIEKN